MGVRKLTDADIKEIQRQAAFGALHRVLAERFKISRSRVTNIVAGRVSRIANTKKQLESHPTVRQPHTINEEES